jgi:hypothetical protein
MGWIGQVAEVPNCFWLGSVGVSKKSILVKKSRKRYFTGTDLRPPAWDLGGGGWAVK